MDANENGFSRSTVMKAADITYRQLDYWARQGVVTPSIRSATGSGSQRRWSFTDILELKLIKKLLNTGVSLQQIRKALNYVRDELGRPLQDVFLVSDGTTIYARTSPDEIIDLLRGGQAVFAIAVGKVYEELQGTIAEIRKPDDDIARPEGPAEAHGG